MAIIGYIVVFIIVGFFIGIIVRNDNLATLIIVLISVLWAFIMGPWAIATFVELIIGHGLGSAVADSLAPTAEEEWRKYEDIFK